MAASFNSDLYVTAATVIPVWFIAVLLPGGVLARYGVWAQAWMMPRMTDADGWKLLGLSCVYALLYSPVFFVLIFGFGGELYAVLALAHRHATARDHQFVMTALIGLTAVATASAIMWIGLAPLLARHESHGGDRRGQV